MIDADPNKPLLEWSQLPGRPAGLTVHPAPTIQDVHIALREARRFEPTWVILDTEGSMRGTLAFVPVRPDLVITPLAGSALEATQAVKAAEMVRELGRRGGRQVPHRCLLTRIPAAIRTRSLTNVLERLRREGVEFLPTALLEKEAFRVLFSIGGGFSRLAASGVSGAITAQRNAEAYVETVVDLVSEKGATTPDQPAG
jgi:chromosome partitioning protein